MSGLSTTVSLWRSLFLLLQDEDQEVRDSASDFMSVPSPLLGTGTHTHTAKVFTHTHNYAEMYLETTHTVWQKIIVLRADVGKIY